jgi:hypothetical protein
VECQRVDLIKVENKIVIRLGRGGAGGCGGRGKRKKSVNGYKIRQEK